MSNGMKCFNGAPGSAAREIRSFAAAAAPTMKTTDRLRAVREMGDQKFLAQTAIQTDKPKVGFAAVDKISDGDLLFNVAIGAKDEGVAARAARGVDDLPLLKKMTMGRHENVRETAMAKLGQSAAGLIWLLKTDAKAGARVFDTADGNVKEEVLSTLAFSPHDTKRNGKTLEALYANSRTAKGIFDAMNMTDCGANQMGGPREHFPC